MKSNHDVRFTAKDKAYLETLARQDMQFSLMPERVASAKAYLAEAGELEVLKDRIARALESETEAYGPKTRVCRILRGEE